MSDPINAGLLDGGKQNASREALLASRECRTPNSAESGHLPYRWHICPVCFPGE